MTLDLARIADQISALVSSVDPHYERERFDALDRAWSELDEAEVNRRLPKAKTSFLLARAAGGYRIRHALPPVPTSYTLVATDGSMITPDRHSPARFYLLNVGSVYLRYGNDPLARMDAEPELRFRETDLYVPGSTRRIPVNESILGLRRATAELRAAADRLADEQQPSLALLDGTLILWALESHDAAVVNWVLPDFLDALQLFRDRGQPVASYISAPGAAEVVNTLRVSICDYPGFGWEINCDSCRTRIATEGHVPACDILPSVPDRYLLERVAGLQPSERTAVFTSDSRILKQYGPELSIRYFYLHAGREIARVEIPAWVANDPSQLDLVHAAIYDQCRLGRGYPVALQEAHEMAVLSMTDRRLVEEVIERRLASQGAVMTHTGKDGSKRGRFV